MLGIGFLTLPAMADDRFSPSDMTLPQVLHRVIETNPGLKAARAELQATRELHAQAMAGWKPTIDAQASVYKSDIENSNFGKADGTTTKDLTFNIEQPLFRSFRTTAEIAEADARITAAEAQLKRIEQNILLSAAQAYMDMVRDRGLFELRRDNENYLEQERAATKEKLDAGMLTVTDLRQAEARLARARAETIDASGQLENSSAVFERITGFYPVQTFYYPDTEAAKVMSKEALMSQAESSNPDMMIAIHNLDAAEHNVEVNFRNHFPQIFAFATYNRQYDPQPGLVDETEDRTIGIRAAIPLYDAGVTLSRTRQARNTAEQRRQQIEDVRRTVHSNIAAQWKAYETSLAETALRRTEISAAESARDGVKEEAQLGERTILDILDADQERIESRAALIRARRDAMVARYTLSALLGNLPDL